MENVKLLVCAECSSRFSEADVLNGLYFFATRVCCACYQRMYLKPASKCCFGKKYSAGSIICTKLCPDSNVCEKVMVDVKIIHLTDDKLAKGREFLGVDRKHYVAEKRGNPFRPDSNIGKLYRFLAKRRTIVEVQKYCRSIDCNYQWALRELRKEVHRGFAWKFSEKDKGLKIYEKL